MVIWQKAETEKLELQQLSFFKDMDQEVKDVLSLFNRYLGTYSKKVKLANLWQKENDPRHVSELLNHIKQSAALISSEIDIYQKESFYIFQCIKDSSEEQEVARKIIKISSRMQITDELNREEELEKYDTVLRENLDKIQTVMQEKLIGVISQEQKIAKEVSTQSAQAEEKRFFDLLHEERQLLVILSNEIKEVFKEVETAARFAQQIYEESESHVFGGLEHRLQVFREELMHIKEYICKNQLPLYYQYAPLKEKTETIIESVDNILTYESEHLKRKVEWVEKYLQNISELMFELCEQFYKRETQQDIFLDSSSIEEYKKIMQLLDEGYAQLSQIGRAFEIDIKGIEYFKEYFKKKNASLKSGYEAFMKYNDQIKIKLFFALITLQPASHIPPLHARLVDLQNIRIRNQITHTKEQADLDMTFIHRLLRSESPEGLDYDMMIQCADSLDFLKNLVSKKDVKVFQADISPKQMMVVDASYLLETISYLRGQIDTFIKTIWELLPENFLTVLERQKLELAMRFELLKHSPMVFKYIESKNILMDQKTRASVSKFLEDMKSEMLSESVRRVRRYWQYQRYDVADRSKLKMPQLIIVKNLKRNEVRAL